MSVLLPKLNARDRVLRGLDLLVEVLEALMSLAAGKRFAAIAFIVCIRRSRIFYVHKKKPRLESRGLTANLQ